MKENQKGRYATHYESIPHTCCNDPAMCDCECPACLEAWEIWKKEANDEH